MDHRRRPFSGVIASWLVCFVLLSPMVAVADTELQTSGSRSADLTKLSLEELMNIEVTSVSKKAEKLSETAAAVYVVTQEDIRRSGVTSIPDALRMVPGLEVAQTSGSEWAVTSRGFNEVYAAKLLVLIDGRPVYTSIHSGVFWDVQDVVLEDVDRIEVIRGPGATMWGANAVNGVINIVTKRASETQGTLVSETVGTVLQNISVVRHGARFGKNAQYRVFGKYLKQGPFVDPMGNDANDSYNLLHGGFRADWDPSDRDQVTLHGDIYTGAKNETLILPFLTEPYIRPVPHNTPLSGGNFLGRWTRVCSGTSDFTLQMYYDRASRGRVMMDEMQETLDLDFQHHLEVDSQHEVIWGFGYRYIADSLRGTPFGAFTPPSFSQRLISAFAQGEIALAPKLLRLTVGSKFEYNDFTGFEIQPSIRLLWTPDSRHTGWAAVSRAVRTPSRLEEDIRLNMEAFRDPADPDLVYLTSLFGNRDFRSEELLAYELGYRMRKGGRFSLDTAAFYNIYNRLRTVEPGTPFFEPSPPPPHVVIPLYFGNKMHGHSYGFELAANWHPQDWWRIVAGYTYLREQLYPDPDIRDPSTFLEENSPRNQFFLRSSLDFGGRIEFDSILRYVGKLPGQLVSSYFALDLRLAWKATDDLEVSIVARDLPNTRHGEFISTKLAPPVTEVPRSWYGKLTWRF